MRRIALLILVGSGAFSCFHTDRRAELFLEGGLEEHGKVLPPLPKGWVYWEKERGAFHPQPGDARIEVIRIPPEGLYSPYRQNSTQNSWMRVYEKTLYTLPYAPRTSFLDPTITIEPRDISSFALHPLDTIQLPYKALRVKGLAPHGGEYPYQGKVVLRISLWLPVTSNTSLISSVTPTNMESVLRSSSDTSSVKKLTQWAESFPGLGEERVLWIGAVGDVLPGRGVERLLLQGEEGIRQVFGDTLSLLKGQDLLLGNLEGTLTTRGTPQTKTFTFRFPPMILEVLKKIGFKYLSLTNNHVWDFGIEGFLDTLQAFQSVGMGTAGVGRSPEEAKLPWEFLIPGGRPIRVLSLGAYPPEKSGFDGRLKASVDFDRPGILWALDSTLESLQNSYGTGGFNILMVHGGYEWASVPHAEQVRLYRRFIDAGVDIVFGSHPHVLQGMEDYRGKLIFYSLGNFLFPGMEETQGGEESIVVSCGVYKGKVRYLEVFPVRLQGPTVRLDVASNTLSRFYQLSKSLQKMYP